MGKWRASQKNVNRNTGGQDLCIGQFILYRLRCVFAGALSEAWADFGGLTAQINNLPHVIEMSITDHPRIAIAYDYRLHLMAHQLAHRRAANTDYFDLLHNFQTEIRAAVLRGFETQADTSSKEKEKQKQAKEKKARARSG